MLEDTATTEESQNTEEVEVGEPIMSTHPYDLPGEWFVLNAQSGHEKKVRTNILTNPVNIPINKEAINNENSISVRDIGDIK